MTLILGHYEIGKLEVFFQILDNSFRFHFKVISL